MNKFQIRIDFLQLSDLDELMKIEAESYGPHHWSRESFVKELDNKIAKYYSVKNSDEELIGYAGVWNIVEEAHITTIAIKENYRRKHIAEALITRILKDCYDNYIKYITLEVRESNNPAINLYKNFGLKSLGTRKGYYQDNGESALIMWSENIFSDSFKKLYNKNADMVNNYLEIK